MKTARASESVKASPRWSVHRRTYISGDESYGCQLTEAAIARIVQLCSKAWPNETGGILIGYYTVDHCCAVVTHVSAAPPDSRSGPTWFHRGVKGLYTQLLRLWWHRQRYYLGEWHFHPDSLPTPSTVDVQQMQVIAQSETYHCPEPLLIILGGRPSLDWQLGVFVFPQGKPQIRLQSHPTQNTIP